MKQLFLCNDFRPEGRKKRLNPQVAVGLEESTGRPVKFATAVRFWLKLGLISFGGPAGQIAIMHSELVEKKRWISESRFLHALNYCMLLPGPEAQQLATYAGWMLHGTIGGIIAGTLFVVPSMFLLWTLSYIYVEFGNVFWVSSVFYGLKAAVTAIVAAAVLRIGRRALKNEVMWLIAAAAFVSIFFLKIPFPIIIFVSAGIGFLCGQFLPGKFQPMKAQTTEGAVIREAGETEDHTKPSWRRAVRILVVCLALWWIPVLALRQWAGPNHTLTQQGTFFSKAAMITFGGAYAVLPYVAQQAVENHHWLKPSQMMDGLGLAETTPGPLIIVVQFVGFLGAWNHPGSLPPLVSATLGALISTWVTFVPCFLWIFLGAPHIEQMRGHVRLNSVLSAVTAAVVGVVLNLAVWFALNAMFPTLHEVDWFLVLLSALCFTVMVRWNYNIVVVILASAVLGLIWKLI